MPIKNKCFVVWVNEEGKWAAVAYELSEYRRWLAENPECNQYHIVDESWLYHLATNDDKLRALEYEQVCEIIAYIEIPF